MLCCICNEEVSEDVAKQRAAKGRCAMYPGVAIDSDPTKRGHVECFIRAGLASIGGRTGPAFADELDVMAAAAVGAPLCWLEIRHGVVCGLLKGHDGPCVEETLESLLSLRRTP